MADHRLVKMRADRVISSWEKKSNAMQVLQRTRPEMTQLEACISVSILSHSIVTAMLEC